MKITVVGGGPRGLSVVLHALQENLEVTLIDPQPLQSWTPPQILSHLEMRSPIRFDLVNYLPVLNHYSLSRFLGYDLPFTTIQSELEDTTLKVTREQFYAYLQFIWQEIKPQISHIKAPALKIQEHQVLTKYGVVHSDAIVIASGSKERKIPNWLEEAKLTSKVISLAKAIEEPLQNEKLMVVGSGQGAAELVHWLAQNNEVYWCINHTPKVKQYPAPSYSEWGLRSALGNYYAGLQDWSKRLAYLEAIKAWQPSHTPYITEKLKEVKYTLINPQSTLDLEKAQEAKYIFLAGGSKPNLKELALEVPIALNPFLPAFPMLEHFKIPDTSIYLSGLLAVAYDGPRQASLISAGSTAKAIIQNIYDRNV